jgi:hypothetical protein
LKFDSPLDKNGNKRKKVAIVGFAESSRHLAPYDNDEWEIWAMNQLYRHLPRGTRWWEMHAYPEYLKDQVPGTDYMKWLEECPIPIYMTEKRDNIPNAISYPISEMATKYGDYFYSTISYMFALAIDEGFTTIGIWGIDLSHDSEYEYQKPSAEYFLGIARGQGIDLVIPPQSALIKGLYRYGYQEMPNNDDIQWLTVYKQRVGAKQQEMVGLVNQLQGQIACAEEFTQWARSKRRGSAPPDPNQPDPDTLVLQQT